MSTPPRLAPLRCMNALSASSPSPRGVFYVVKAGVCVAGGSDRPAAIDFEKLSLAPWAYMCQVMGITRAVAGVAAAALVLHLVWPLRGPVALGGEGGGKR